MKPISTITSRAIPILRDNIDTDTIIPSREMRSTGRTGLAEGLFAPWRYSNADARVPNPSFALNRPEAKDAKVLLGGRNFGCGSSREHAVWALAEYGIEAIVAPSFAPIFKANCLRNGLLPIELAQDVVERLAWQRVEIDLAAQSLRSAEGAWSFDIDPEAKRLLIEGLDFIDATLSTMKAAIDAFLERDRKARPWIYLGEAT